MTEISATDASKRFADLLDAVEHRGETFTVVRRGRAVATIAPARGGTGADLRRIVARHPADSRWADELRELRRFAGEASAADPSRAITPCCWLTPSAREDRAAPTIFRSTPRPAPPAGCF